MDLLSGDVQIMVIRNSVEVSVETRFMIDQPVAI